MGNKLIDFMQGASNAAASNVSAPVDGLAWLMRKAGINVGDSPMGGSNWMRAKGLTAEPQNRLAGILGESLGGVAPMLAAAKAPQIANGLLKMGENAMAPRTLNPQTGAVVWHGSPHKFDAFDSSKIGTGEGAQAYGHGLYLADSREVAGSYQAKLTDEAFKYKAMNDAKTRLHKKLALRLDATDPARAASLRADVASLGEPGGSLYKVDLPDEHIAKMLDWDKPLSAQHPDVQKAMQGLNGKDALGRPLERAQPLSMDSNGQWAYMNIQEGRNQRLASEALQKAGIPGIRYLDGGSRATGGTSNYVVFPGNESLLKILERNGKATP